MTRRWFVLCLFLAVVPACTVDIGTPHNVPAIRVISDINRADTIDAEPGSRLVLAISDSTGSLRRQVVVNISGMPSAAPGVGLGMLAIDTLRTQAGNIAAVTTGEVAFFVKFGPRAGPAAIIVQVPELQLTDTLWFTVKPGAPSVLTLRPADTSIVVGSSYKQDGVVVDRHANEVSPAPQLSIRGLDPGISVASTGDVTGSSYSRARIEVSYGSFIDTALVSVVPSARLAGSAWAPGPEIRVANTNGVSTLRYPTISYTGGPRWTSDGAHLLYSDDVFPDPFAGALRRIFSVSTLTGTATLIMADTVSALRGLSLIWPSPSYDGSWIYFMALVGLGTTNSIWRVHFDGSGAEQVVSPQPAGAPFVGLGSPSASRDGSLLAYFSNGDVIILNMTTGSTVKLTGLDPGIVRWSPTADRLAIRGRAQGLYLANADGTGLTTLTSDRSAGLTLDWSPDGAWLLVAMPKPGALSDAVMINVQSGLRLPLWLNVGGELAWAPN